MKKYLFSSRALRAIAVGAAVAAVAVPASSASASLLDTTSTSLLSSSTLFATAQGTSILGQEVPVLGTQGWYVTLPVGSNVLPGETLVWGLLDFTVTSEVKVGNVEIVNLYLDPHMAK